MDRVVQHATFEQWVVDIKPRLERAFLARYGMELVDDVTAETVAWAWQHQDELMAMANPAGYLFRVGQSKARRFLRWRQREVVMPSEVRSGRDSGSSFEPGLGPALARLSDDHRVAVVLVHCFGWTQPELAEFLEVDLHIVRNRVHRGLNALKLSMGVDK